MRNGFDSFKGISCILGIGAVIIFFASCETRESLTKKRITGVERSLLETVTIKETIPKKMDIMERMLYYRVPGVSLAVIDNYEIEWSKAYGVKEVDTSHLVNPTTLFQVGELGLPLTALGILHFVEKGDLNLDEDVNISLSSWKVPQNAKTQKTPLTLRHLLSHSSGATLKTLPGIKQGEALPTLDEILTGTGPAANSPMTIDFEPGSLIRPSMGGAVIIQQIIEDVVKKSFLSIMEEAVLEPLGLDQTLYDPLPDKETVRAAYGHKRDGSLIEGKWLQQSVPAASGLWSTAEDLARLTLNIVKTAMGSEQSIISSQLARTMLTPSIGNRGLGFSIDDTGNNININIQGETEGYRAYAILYPQRGQGAVILANSVNGQFLIEEILRSISLVYEWPHFQPQIKPLYRLQPEVYQQYVGQYEVNPEYILTIAYEDYYLIIQPTGQAPTRFFVENPTTFFSTAPHIQIRFDFDEQSRVIGLTLKQAGQEQKARKIE